MPKRFLIISDAGDLRKTSSIFYAKSTAERLCADKQVNVRIEDTTLSVCTQRFLYRNGEVKVDAPQGKNMAKTVPPLGGSAEADPPGSSPADWRAPVDTPGPLRRGDATMVPPWRRFYLIVTEKLQHTKRVRGCGNILSQAKRRCQEVRHDVRIYDTELGMYTHRYEWTEPEVLLWKRSPDGGEYLFERSERRLGRLMASVPVSSTAETESMPTRRQRAKSTPTSLTDVTNQLIVLANPKNHIRSFLTNLVAGWLSVHGETPERFFGELKKSVADLAANPEISQAIQSFKKSQNSTNDEPV